jgi:hypothetical protein
MWYIFKVNMVHKKLIVNKSFSSFNCDPTHLNDEKIHAFIYRF